MNIDTPLCAILLIDYSPVVNVSPKKSYSTYAISQKTYGMRRMEREGGMDGWTDG